MLVTFTTAVYADITLFGDIALRLIKMTGHSGTVPSAILADDVPAALERLRSEIQNRGEDETLQGGGGGEHSVSLAHRALPLIKLFETAAKEKRDVMWTGK